MAGVTALGPTVPTPATPAVRAVPAALVSAALMGTSALAYVFTVLAARTLMPHAYGELAALLGVALVGTVPATGLQTAAALALGGSRGDPRPVIRRLHATTLAGAVLVAVVGALGIAPVARLLHLPDPRALAWVLLLLVGHTVVGGYEGVLQGTGRYARMAVVTTAFGVTKLAGGVAGLLAGGTPTAALGRHAVTLVGGSAYGSGAAGAVWLFAVLGTLLAAAQLLLYSGLAAADRRSVLAVWVAAVVECVAVEVLAATGRLSIPSLVGAAGVTAALLVTTGLLRLRSR
jgi:hypothetical protein